MQNADMAQQAGGVPETEGHSAGAERELAHRLEEANARSQQLEILVRNALADARHARQRADADLLNAHKFAIEDFAKSLLPFKDALETALVVDTTDIKAMQAGLELSLRQLQAAFERNGVEDPCKGRLFTKR